MELLRIPLLYQPKLFVIIPVIILTVFLAGGVWSIWKAFRSNEVEYGYKYYPPKYISNRKTDPFGFWSRT